MCGTRYRAGFIGIRWMAKAGALGVPTQMDIKIQRQGWKQTGFIYLLHSIERGAQTPFRPIRQGTALSIDRTWVSRPTGIAEEKPIKSTDYSLQPFNVDTAGAKVSLSERLLLHMNTEKDSRKRHYNNNETWATSFQDKSLLLRMVWAPKCCLALFAKDGHADDYICVSASILLAVVHDLYADVSVYLENINYISFEALCTVMALRLIKVGFGRLLGQVHSRMQKDFDRRASGLLSKRVRRRAGSGGCPEIDGNRHATPGSCGIISKMI
ncbi:hypothetical protein HPP92_028817 [Vanilla planifolia]|uniref:Uncharacterized protein n=1 Tax=Vanilla planifolia TaxID=51239 RepID=A0A835P6A9_VANPL|nr:hypothetical protein HPP92_028817 [Vanilla planifolia]KAG0446489.1 hypothetical protein HPP92_028806 [Vanilla planifolia]